MGRFAAKRSNPRKSIVLPAQCSMQERGVNKSLVGLHLEKNDCRAYSVTRPNSWQFLGPPPAASQEQPTALQGMPAMHLSRAAAAAAQRSSTHAPSRSASRLVLASPLTCPILRLPCLSASPPSSCWAGRPTRVCKRSPSLTKANTLTTPLRQHQPTPGSTA